MSIATAFFYLFSIGVIASAVMVISARNPVHSVLFLILAFVNAAGLFLLAGAEFLAMILVVVYVGAVAVLFLFVVMMLDVDFAELKQGFLQYLPVGMLVGLILLVELVTVVGVWAVAPQTVLANSDARRPQQYGGDRRGALHPICLSVPGGGFCPADGDDRRDCPYPATQAACAAPEYCRTERAHPRLGHRKQESPVSGGRVRSGHDHRS